MWIPLSLQGMLAKTYAQCVTIGTFPDSKIYGPTVTSCHSAFFVAFPRGTFIRSPDRLGHGSAQPVIPHFAKAAPSGVLSVGNQSVIAHLASAVQKLARRN